MPSAKGDFLFLFLIFLKAFIKLYSFKKLLKSFTAYLKVLYSSAFRVFRGVALQTRGGGVADKLPLKGGGIAD